MTRKTTSRRARPAASRGRGFTIVELLVAVSLLALMMFLMNDLFGRTTRAVSDGVRASTVLANARATNDRIARDASTMLGPNSQNPVPEGGGYLIIINHEVNAPVKRVDGSTVIETFRIDQLVFMASATAADSKVQRFRSGTPRDGSQFGSDYTSPYALVRYSHARRTERNGNDNAAFIDLGQPFVFGDPTASGRAAGLDRLANDWVLARQTVLFDPTDRFGDSINLPANLANDWYVQAPFINSQIINEASNNPMYAGYCDITNVPPSGSATGPTPGFVDLALDPANASLTPAQIEANYLALTHIDQRLRVNPIPDANDFEAVRIGQLSGVFAPNCSDFIVQFAADADNDGDIDRVGPNGNDGGANDPIYWYDMDAINDLGADPWGTAAWTGTPVPSPLVDVSASNHGTTAFIFRYEDDQAYSETTPGNGDVDNSKWPYLIRIRYRLHDAPGRLESNASFRLFDNKDQNLNATDDDADEAIVSGRYFEQVIRVPRP